MLSKLAFSGAAVAVVVSGNISADGSDANVAIIDPSSTDLAGHYVSEIELEHFRLVNELRAEGYTCHSGTAYAPNPEPLKFDCRLWRAARLHTVDMVEQGYLSHVSKDGRSFTDRASAQGIAAAGENIGMDYGMTAASAVDLWKTSSSGHCDGMMNPNRFLIGAAIWEVPSNNWSKGTQMYAGSNWVDTLDESCIPTSPNQSPSPTPGPTPRPTPPPVPTHEPTPWPTYESVMKTVCHPMPDCIADADCQAKYLPMCATFGADLCGASAAVSNDPETEFCVLDQVAEDDLIPVCGPHPDDANATWQDCYSTIHWDEEQCTTGAEAKGITCQWIMAPYEGIGSLMSIIYG